MLIDFLLGRRWQLPYGPAAAHRAVRQRALDPWTASGPDWLAGWFAAV